MAKKNFTDLSIKDQDKSKTVKFFVDAEQGVVVCRLYDRWDDIFHTAKTRCHDVDKFNEKKGRAIAFNKAKRKELLHNLKNVEMEKKYLDELYNARVEALTKRAHINTIYLEGVNLALEDLMK